MPSDLSPALLLNRTELRRLQERIKELQVENIEQRDLRSEARQQQVRLIHELKDMDADIQRKIHTGQSPLLPSNLTEIPHVKEQINEHASRFVCLPKRSRTEFLCRSLLGLRVYTRVAFSDIDFWVWRVFCMCVCLLV